MESQTCSWSFHPSKCHNVRDYNVKLQGGNIGKTLGENGGNYYKFDHNTSTFPNLLEARVRGSHFEFRSSTETAPLDFGYALFVRGYYEE